VSNYLYLVQCNECFKIGVAGNVEARLVALQTGNPYQLVVRSCYEYENASTVEQSLHQKYASKRVSGEWFQLDSADLTQFDQICELLGGKKNSQLTTVTEEATEEAELIGEITSEETSTLSKFDFEQMFRDGWRIETSGKNDRRYWIWRRGSGSNRKSIYGGRVKDIPQQFRPTE
jgi:hypothetical protein